MRSVYDGQKMYTGPYTDNGPDLIIGYEEGYRISWDAAVGKVKRQVFEDNMKSWSGDHCIDPKQVPGVLFCNRKIDAKDPGIMDIAPTILQEYNLRIPQYMDGTPLFRNTANKDS